MALGSMVSVMQIQAQTLILVDVSGSMKGNEALLTQVITDLSTKLQRLQVFAFNNTVTTVKDYSTFFPAGGTNMSAALERAKQHGSKTVFIITDGLPNDEDRARKLSQQIRKSGTNICTVYMGMNSQGEKFAREISTVMFLPYHLDKTLMKPCIRHAKEHQWDIALFQEENLTEYDSVNLHDTSHPVHTDVVYEQNRSGFDSM